MGATKTDLYSDDLNSLARRIHALAHPARLTIVRELLTARSRMGNDFVKQVGLSQATISQHVRELKEVGLVKNNFEGRNNRFCLDRPSCTSLLREINGLFS